MTAWLISGVRVWDGRGDAYLPDVDAVRIEGERIAAVGRSGELGAGATDLALPGAHLIPGLIDAHVHLGIDPSISDPEAQLRVPEAEQERGMRERCAAMLRAGITTARDLGGPCWREVDLRERIARGELPGPRLLCAGQPLTTPRGHCWFWGGEVANREQMRAAVARQVEHGVDWIKAIATGGLVTRGTRPDRPQFSARELRALVREAAAHGRPVAAHCHGTAGIRRAAAAGVRSVEHCSFAGSEGFGSDYAPSVVRRLAKAGCWVSPTVNAGWGRFFGPDGESKPFAQRMNRVYRGLREAGVPLVASTDAGIPGVAHDRLPQALPVFARIAGLSAAETLRTATSESAAALGLAERGEILPGRAADLIALDADPLRDLRALEKPRSVWARGRRFDVEPGLSVSESA
ncbi:MAG: amidohydrolase family protein [Proteobacteria bacterium]|nr:amidohydrolase family protein [Pseudomonadota bacterium]